MSGNIKNINRNALTWNNTLSRYGIQINSAHNKPLF